MNLEVSQTAVAVTRNKRRHQKHVPTGAVCALKGRGSKTMSQSYAYF